MRAHALAAIRAGFEPHLFCVAPSPSVVETPFGIVHRVASPARPFRQLVAGAHAPFLAAEVERFLAGTGAKEPRVIHAFGVWGSAAVLAARRLAREGVEAVPLVSSYTTYGAESRSKLRGARSGYGLATLPYYVLENLFVRGVSERAEKAGYRGAGLVLVNYESVRRLVVARWGSGIPIRLVPYAAESAFAPSRPPDASPPPGLPSGTAPLLLSVSRHDPRKGIDVLLRALARLKERRVPFRACLVGEGRLLETNRRFAASLGLGSEVSLPGLVPDVLPYLGRADVFVLPSREEQSGSISLLEALQAGRPAVASACDGIPEDVTDGTDALLVPPDDAPALADALERVLGDPALRARLARAARATFENRFGAGRVAGALADVWAECGQTARQSGGRPAQQTSPQRS